MQSTYLKERLAQLATIKAGVAHIVSSENRKAHESRLTGGISTNAYPAILGEVQGILFGAYFDIEAAQSIANDLEVMEREHERLISILESIGVNMDEEDLKALEVLATDDEYKYERRALARAINKAIGDTQESEREIEHDAATDALVAAGFVYEEESDTFTRGNYAARITLTNGRESRYSWEYTYTEPDALPNHYSILDSGKSGDFSRLIALVAPKPTEPLPGGGSLSSDPCDTAAKA